MDEVAWITAVFCACSTAKYALLAAPVIMQLEPRVKQITAKEAEQLRCAMTSTPLGKRLAAVIGWDRKVNLKQLYSAILQNGMQEVLTKRK